MSDDLDRLAETVEAMRRLGVTRWKDIELGPDPAASDLDHQHQNTSPVATPPRRPTGGLVPRDGDSSTQRSG